MVRRRWIAIVVLLLAVVVSACSSSVDASKTRSQAVIESGGIPPPDELRVAEYVDYYQQKFPSPVDSTLGLDLRLGNQQIPVDGGEAWLQIGVQARSADSDVVAPLNVAIVIDKSGSMDSPEKMPYLKQSLRVFLHSLAPNDLVAIVAFDNQAQVLEAASPVGDGHWIDATVDRLEPGGGTNLEAGLLAGFQEVDRNFDVRRNNRVLVLTDGVANQGVTDPDTIAAEARQYNDKGIYLSTIGLGRDVYNDALLIKLANQGQGAYHFVDSAAEMDKVFHQEVAGLVQKAAADVSVTVRPGSGVTVESLTGYDGQPPAGPVQVPLRDLGTGDSHVLVVRLKVASGQPGSRSLATVELQYHDLFSTHDAAISRSIDADAARIANYDPVWDTEVLRNVTVERTAEGLKQISQLYQAHQYTEAWQIAYQREQDLRVVAQLSGDQQLVKDAGTMRTYENTLAKWVQQQTGQPPRPDDGPVAPPTGSSRGLLPTPTVSVLEVR